MTISRDILEFSRPLAVEDIGSGLERDIRANRAECAALAKRMKLPAIHAFDAHFSITPQGEGACLVRGRIRAEIDQECVRTLEIFTSTLRAEVERLFVPEGSKAALALESGRMHDIDPEAEDAPDIIRDGEIDLGELAAETLALSLDPWPKKPGTDFIDVEAAVPGEESSTQETERKNPFSVLGGMKFDFQ